MKGEVFTPRNVRPILTGIYSPHGIRTFRMASGQRLTHAYLAWSLSHRRCGGSCQEEGRTNFRTTQLDPLTSLPMHLNER